MTTPSGQPKVFTPPYVKAFHSAGFRRFPDPVTPGFDNSARAVHARRATTPPPHASARVTAPRATTPSAPPAGHRRHNPSVIYMPPDRIIGRRPQTPTQPAGKPWRPWPAPGLRPTPAPTPQPRRPHQPPIVVPRPGPSIYRPPTPRPVWTPPTRRGGPDPALAAQRSVVEAMRASRQALQASQLTQQNSRRAASQAQHDARLAAAGSRQVAQQESARRAMQQRRTAEPRSKEQRQQKELDDLKLELGLGPVTDEALYDYLTEHGLLPDRDASAEVDIDPEDMSIGPAPETETRWISVPYGVGQTPQRELVTGTPERLDVLERAARRQQGLEMAGGLLSGLVGLKSGRGSARGLSTAKGIRGRRRPSQPRARDTSKGPGSTRQPDASPAREPGLKDAYWLPGGWMRSEPRSDAVAPQWLKYERQVQRHVGQPVGASLYAAGTEFDSYYLGPAGKTLVDAKFGFRGGFYDVGAMLKPSSTGPRLRRPVSPSEFTRASRLTATVERQLAAAKQVGAQRVEWFCPDPVLATQLNSAFRQLGVGGTFKATYLPSGR